MLNNKIIEANKYFESGKNHLNEGRFEDAISDFTKAMELHQKNAEYYFYRGNAHRNLGNLYQARRNYKQVIKMNPEHFGAYTNLALTYVQADFGLIYASARSQYDMAKQNYEKAVEINPQYVIPHYNLGNIHSANGFYTLAIQNYSKAIEIEPNYAPAYHNRGSSHLALGNLDLALADYNKAIEIDPFCMSAYTNRSNIYLDTGKYQLAVQDMPFITDETILQEIAEEAKKHMDTLDTEALVMKAKKLNFLITTYHLMLHEARALFSAGENIRTWLLQEWQQITREKDIDDNNVSINKSLSLPAELWELISTFVVGLDTKGVYKIQDIVNRQLQYSFRNKPYSTANHACMYQPTPNASEKAEADRIVDIRYERRRFF